MRRKNHWDKEEHETAMERRKKIAVRGEHYINVMSKIFGQDIRGEGRTRPLPQLRWMVAKQLQIEGASTKDSGLAIGKAYPSIIRGLHAIDFMLEHPAMFPEEMKYWDKFQKQIKL